MIEVICRTELNRMNEDESNWVQPWEIDDGPRG